MNKETLKLKMGQAAPYIAFTTGVVSVIGAVASAIYATTKLSYILDEHEMEAEEIAVEFEESTDEDAEKHAKKRYRKLNRKTCGRVLKNYAGTIGCTALAISSFSFSFGKMRSNYLQTAATLGAVSSQFDTYRDRVIEDAGEDKDTEYYYGVKKEKVVVEEKDPETGRVKKTKKELLTGEVSGLYSYRWKKQDTRDMSGSSQYEGIADYDYTYITGIIRQFQNKLDLGHVSKVKLDDLLEELGFEHDTKYHEAIAGWLPGDTILCGLECSDVRGNDTGYTLTEDAYNFLVGKSNEVTLRFNPRPDTYGVIVLETELGATQSDYISEKASPEYKEYNTEETVVTKS